MELLAREEAQRILSREQNARKHIRQLQVRQQFQCWSEEQRRKVQVEKKNQIQKLKAKMAEKEQKLAIEKIQKLLLMHELTLNSIGEAHRAAANMPNYQQIRIEKELLNLSKAKVRGLDALKREKLISEEQKRPMMVAKEIRETVRMYEDLKAKDLVEKRPFRPRNNVFDTKSGKDQVFAYNEHLSNLLNAPVGHQKKANADKDKPIKSILKKNTSITTTSSIKEKESKKIPSVFAQVAHDPQNHPKISFKYPSDQNRGNKKKSKKMLKRRDKINYVSFYDDSLPNVPELAREPKGLFRREKSPQPGELNAWEEAILISKDKQVKQLEESRKSEERQKVAEERGRKALALAKLEARLNEYIASLNDDDALKLKNDLIQDDSFTDDEIEELFKRSRTKSTPMVSLLPPRPRVKIGSSSSSSPGSIGSLTPPKFNPSSSSQRSSFKKREREDNENEFDDEVDFDESTVDHSRLPSPSKSLKRTPFKELDEEKDQDEIMDYLSHAQEIPPFTPFTQITPLHQEKLTLSDLDLDEEGPSSLIQSSGPGSVKSKKERDSRSRKSFREYLLDKNFNESFQKDKSSSTTSSSVLSDANKNKNNLSSSTSTTDYLDLSSPTIFRLRLCETSNSLDTPTSDKSTSQSQHEHYYNYPETSTPFSATKKVGNNESSSSGSTCGVIKIKPKVVRTNPRLEKYIKKLLTMRPESVQGLSGNSSCDSSSFKTGRRTHISLSTTCGSEDIHLDRISQDSPSSITITSSSDTTTSTTTTTTTSNDNDTINQVQFSITPLKKTKTTKSLQLQSRPQVIEIEHGSEKSKSSDSSKNSSKEFLRGEFQSNPSILDPIEKISNSIHSLTSSANDPHKTKDSKEEESAESIFREIIEGFNSVTIELPSWIQDKK